MSDEQSKEKNSKRRFRDEIAIKKQLKIVKPFMSKKHKLIEEPHRLAKHHGMNCGNPKCLLCGNPRKFFKERTIQEKKFMQESEKVNNRHSNGLKPEDE